MNGFTTTQQKFPRRTFIKGTAAAVAAFALPRPIFAENKSKISDSPDYDSILEAAKTLINRPPLSANDTQPDARKIFQKASDNCTPDEYHDCVAPDISPEKLLEHEKKQPVLAALNCAAKKVVEEITQLKTDERDGDSVRMWLVYNMGYIVKTRGAVFGIDIVHPHCESFAPLLDFLLITHYHRDHYSPKLVKLMGEKPVVSNFLENKYVKTSGVGEYDFNGVQIRTTIGDHSRTRKIPVSAFEIACGNKTIYHVGDSCRWEQLNPTKRPDVFIPHLSVGLDIKKCVGETIRPDITLVSHILELGHPLDKYRWPIKLGLKRCAELAPAKALLPFWGNSYEIA